MTKEDAKRGVLTPDELGMLQQLFDAALQERTLEKDSGDTQTLAVTLLQLYQSGIREAKTLQSRIEKQKN